MGKRKKGTTRKKPEFLIGKKSGTLREYQIVPIEKSGNISNEEYLVDIAKSTEGQVGVLSAKKTYNSKGKVIKRTPIKAHKNLAGAGKRFPRITPALPRLK